jgi:ribosomal protein S18 acetylase RimI-like enzyme
MADYSANRTMHIRKFEPQDRRALIDLWRRVFPDDPPHNEPASVIDAKLAVDDLIFLVERSGEIMGACMAGWDGHRGWLYAVAVLPEIRRTGVGSMLVTTAIRELKQLGCIKVNLQIRASNTENVVFYESLGFSVEERVSMGALINDGT